MFLAFHILLLPPPPSSPGLKFPGWSNTNLFSSSLQYLHFVLAKKTSFLTLFAKKPLRDTWQCLISRQAQYGAEWWVRGHRQTLGSVWSWVARGLLDVGPSSNDTEERDWSCTWACWFGEDQGAYKLYSLDSPSTESQGQLRHRKSCLCGCTSWPQKFNQENIFLQWISQKTRAEWKT